MSMARGVQALKTDQAECSVISVRGLSGVSAGSTSALVCYLSVGVTAGNRL